MTKNASSKMFPILEYDFLTPHPFFVTTPQKDFFAILTNFKIFGKQITFLNLFGVHTPPFKIWFIFVEN